MTNSFIDAEDSPPTSCGVSLPRDCSGTCIVTAIANYVGSLSVSLAIFVQSKDLIARRLDGFKTEERALLTTRRIFNF